MVPKVIWRAPGDLFGGFLFWVWAFGSAADLPLNFHPAAIRASAGFALRPNFGPPAGRVFRLCHDGGLAAPS